MKKKELILNKLLKSKDLYILFALYLIANVFLLINIDGLYWDDWVAYKQTNETMKIFFSEIQHGIKGDFFLFLSQFGNSIYPFRLFIFFATFLMGIFVYLILSTIKELDKQTVFFITLFFLIIPVNSTKILISIAPFTFPVFIFYFTFYLLTLYVKYNSFLLRLLILALFFISFSTNSVLVFYFSIFLYLYYIHFNFANDRLLDKLKFLLKQYWDFLLLPFVYFIYKMVYLKPYGLYEGYNGLSLGSFLKAPILIFQSFYTSLIQSIDDSFIFIGTMSSIVLLYVLYKVFRRYTTEIKFENISEKIFLFAGIVMFILAVFPYCMVGKLPSSIAFDSRFELLTPIGISFILYFSLQYFINNFNFNNYMKLSIMTILTIVFITKNLYDGYKYNMDWFHSISLQENIRNLDVVKNNTTFIISTSYNPYLVNGRLIGFYEYNGMLKRIFRNDSRLAVNKHEEINLYSKYQSYKQYNFSSWVSTKPIYLQCTANRIAKKDTIKLFYYYLFDESMFREFSKKMTTIYEVKGAI